MSLRELIREWLGIADFEKTMVSMEERLNEIEDQLGRFGNYEYQTKEVLEFMKDNIMNWMQKVEDRLNRIENRVDQHDIDKAKALLRRLRYNNTRIGNILRKAS